MWVFLILVSLGFVFMLYALVQFFREGKRRTSNRQRRSNPNTWKPQTGRVAMIDSIQSARKHSSSERRTAELSHDNREIQIRITCTDSSVVLRRIRASARHTSGISRSPESVSRAD
jgi:hypothetical protein